MAMTALHAKELSSLVVGNDEARAEPLIHLIAGMTDARGDPQRDAVRTEVLRHLYAQTEDFRHHFRNYLEAATPAEGVIQTSTSAS